MQKKISVIVPVYNTEEYLNRCAESIINQTFQKLEIILVDDGSTDSGPQMCDSLAAQDNRIRVIHKKNGGLMSAWMAGVRASSGDYLCFVDSDDWIDLCMVEELAGKATGESGEIICCNFVIERPEGTEKHSHELKPGIYAGKELQRVKQELLGNERRTVSMSRCMKLFSRELIADNLKYCNPAIRMGEDVNIVLPALCDCTRLVILEDAHYYHYFYNTSSMVHRYDPLMYQGIRELVGTIQKIFQEKCIGRGISNWEQQWEKENLYLVMLAVKNELRGARAGYADRLREICREETVQSALMKYPLHPEDRANQIILWVMRKPDGFRCGAARKIFDWYDRMKKSKNMPR